MRKAGRVLGESRANVHDLWLHLWRFGRCPALVLPANLSEKKSERKKKLSEGEETASLRKKTTKGREA